MNKKVILALLLVISLTFSMDYGGGGSSGSSGSSDSGGTVNKPSGCAVEKCEQLSIDVFEPICVDGTLNGLHIVVKDSRNMPVEGASVFMSGRFLGLPTKTTDKNGEVTFDKGFVEKQPYSLSASKSGKPDYDNLYGYKPAESKNFIYGGEEINCNIKNDNSGTYGPGYCTENKDCKDDEFCNDQKMCASLNTVASGLYSDGCFRVEDHQVIRDPCCENYELTVSKDSGFVGEFVPVAVMQCGKQVFGKQVTITNPTGEASTITTNESGFGIVLAQPGAYKVAYKEAAKQVQARQPEEQNKPLLTLIGEFITKNSILILAAIILLLIFFYWRRRKKKEEALSENKKKRIREDIEEGK